MKILSLVNQKGGVGKTTLATALAVAATQDDLTRQALADMQTLFDLWGSLAGRTVAFVGDGNNVATSFVHAAVNSGW